MQNREHYVAIAEKIFFRGITEEGLRQVATYKNGKGFQDVKDAVSRGLTEGQFEINAKLDNIAFRLGEVIDIMPPETPLHEYEDRLRVT